MIYPWLINDVMHAFMQVMHICTFFPSCFLSVPEENKEKYIPDNTSKKKKAEMIGVHRRKCVYVYNLLFFQYVSFFIKGCITLLVSCG